MTMRVLPWVCLLSMTLVAVANAETGEDHPEVARYPGTEIRNYDFKEYEEFNLILSKPEYKNHEYVAARQLPLEGKVTYIHYEMPKSVSALQVFRNYQSALRRAGFSELFVCERPCTEENLGAFRELMKARDLYLNYSRDNQYLAVQRNNTYVSLWVNEGGVWQFVVEKQALNDNVMEVRGVSAMAKALNSAGKVDVYGFQFDTGKAVLKDGSDATLKELAQVLQDNPALSVAVVGHTDNVGSADANQKLSEQRALAVVMALTTRFDIALSRMQPRGMGQNAPLADNTSESGRAKNRRVEIMVTSNAVTGSATTKSASSASSQTAEKNAAKSAQSSSKSASQSSSAKSRNLEETADKVMNGANKLKGLFGH